MKILTFSYHKVKAFKGASFKTTKFNSDMVIQVYNGIDIIISIRVDGKSVKKLIGKLGNIVDITEFMYANNILKIRFTAQDDVIDEIYKVVSKYNAKIENVIVDISKIVDNTNLKTIKKQK